MAINQFVARNGIISLNDVLVTGSIITTTGVTGSVSGSLIGTASYSTSASAATTASSVGNLNQAVTITGSLAVSGSSGSTVFTSNIDTLVLTGSMTITGSLTVTGSIAGTASYASQANSSSYATSASFSAYAISASNVPGYTVNFTQATPATTWSFTHNLNTRNPIVQVYDTTYKQIIPNQIVAVDAFNAQVLFDYSQSGYVVMSNGGGLYVTGSTSLLYATSSVTWSFQHNLNSQYINFTAYDSNNNVIIPSGIKAISANYAELYFGVSQSGVAVAQFSGIGGSPNAASASYALTSSYAISSSYAVSSSYADNFIVKGNITAQTLVVQTITSSVVYSSGSNVFGNSIANTQQFTGSVLVTGSIGITGSISTFGTAVFSTSVLSQDYRYTNTGYITYDVANTGVESLIIRKYGTAVLTFNSASAIFGNSIGIVSSPNAKLDLGGTVNGNYKNAFLFYNDNNAGPFYGTKNGFYMDQFSLSNNVTLASSTAAGAPGSFIIAGKNTAVNDASSLSPIFIINTQTGATALSGSLSVNGGNNLPTFTIKGNPAFDGESRLYLTNNAYIYGRTNLILTGRLDGGNDSFSFGTSNRLGIVFNANEGGAQGATGTEYYGIQLELNSKTLAFQSSGSNAAGRPATLALTQAGNVGIGTTSPVSVTNQTSLTINGTSVGRLDLSAGGSSNTAGMYATSAGGTVFSFGDLPFLTGASTTERFRITSNGDAGQFSIKGGVSNYKQLNWGAALIMGRDAYDSYYCGDTYYDGSTWRNKYGGDYANVVNWYSGAYSFQRGTTAAAADGAITLQSNMYLDLSGNLVIRGSLTQNGSPSDINLKENLVKISSPLEKISQINGYNFDWKEGSTHNNPEIPLADGMPAPETPITSTQHDAGLIAQEVEAIMPELVRDNGHKALNYNGVIALLVEGIKEQQTTIQSLTDRITALESK